MALTPRRRPSAQPLPAQTPSLGQPNLQPLATGLDAAGRGMAALEESRFRLEQRDEKERLQRLRFDTQRRLQTFIGEQERAINETLANSPANGIGVAKGINEGFSVASSEFLESIPAPLRDEFAPRVETFRQQVLTNADNFERKRFRDFEALELENAVEQATSAILAGEDKQTAMAPVFALLGASTLDELEKERVFDTLEEGTTEAGFYRYLYEARQIANGEVLPDGDTTVVDLGENMNALANLTASTESAGRYDVMYSPGGELRTFSDFSKHPNIPVEIPGGNGEISTAAGRYQFTYETWIEAKEALNLPDFSPASQDRAFAWLAEQRFRQVTGDDLETALAQGRVADVVEALGRSTWIGLRSVGGDAAAKLEENRAMPLGVPNPLTDPMFEGISPDRKIAMLEDAQLAADNAAKQRRAERQREEALRTENILNRILIKRDLGPMEVERMRENGEFDSVNQYQQAQNALAQVRVKETERGEALGIYADAVNGIDTLQSATKSQMNTLFDDPAAEALAENNPEVLWKGVGAMPEGLVGMAARGNLPTRALNLLRQKALSGDVRSAEFALDALSLMTQGASGTMDRLLTDDELLRVDAWNYLKPYGTAEENIEYLRKQTTAQGQRELAVFRDTALEEVQEKGLATGEKIVDGIGGAVPTNNAALARMEQEYLTIARRDAHLFQGDVDALDAHVLKEMKRYWGVTGLGQGQRSGIIETERTFGPTGFFMKYPPENVGYRPDLLPRYEAQLRSDLEGAGIELDEDTTIQLVADARTAREVDRWKLAQRTEEMEAPLPTYRGVVFGPEGFRLTSDNQISRRWGGDEATLPAVAATPMEEQSRGRGGASGIDTSRWTVDELEKLREIRATSATPGEFQRRVTEEIVRPRSSAQETEPSPQRDEPRGPGGRLR